MAHRTRKLGIETSLLTTVHVQDNGAPLGHAKSSFKTLGQALGHILANFQTVHHHVQIMFFVLFKRWHFTRLKNLGTQSKAHKPAHLQRAQLVREFALFATCEWRQNHDARVLGHREHRVDHLRDGLGLQGHTMLWAMRCPRSGKQQAQIIVNFCHGAHRGAWVVAGGFLLNRDRWRQAFNQVHIGLVHPLEELPCIGGQTLHIAALAFGIQGIKCEAGFARARQTRDHHQLVPGQVQINVFQIMGASTSNADEPRPDVRAAL